MLHLGEIGQGQTSFHMQPLQHEPQIDSLRLNEYSIPRPLVPDFAQSLLESEKLPYVD
jgi:hypothetical protein